MRIPLIILSASFSYRITCLTANHQLSIVNCQLHEMLRFALHFAFASNMSKIRGIYHLIIYHLPFKCSTVNSQCSMPEWKPEGLDLSAGPVPVFPIIYIVFTETRELQHPKHATCEPRSTADLRRLNLRLSARFRLPQPKSSERRCSSRTFRYGYLVTT